MNVSRNSLNGSRLLLGSILLLSACSHAPKYLGQVVAVDAPRDGRVTSVELGPFTSASECEVMVEAAILYTKSEWTKRYPDRPFPRRLAVECRVAK